MIFISGIFLIGFWAALLTAYTYSIKPLVCRRELEATIIDFETQSLPDLETDKFTDNYIPVYEYCYNGIKYIDPNKPDSLWERPRGVGMACVTILLGVTIAVLTGIVLYNTLL